MEGGGGVGADVTDEFYHVFWVSKINHSGKESCMVNGSECNFEVNVCEVYIVVGEFSVFKCCYNHLYLPCSMLLRSKTFVVKV